MPLLLISGYPSSGKSYRSQQLYKYFTSRIESSQDPKIQEFSTVHIDADSLGLDRRVYAEAKTEKDARATEYSAVKRALSGKVIVIADGLNYIKGFRYQLHCEAKAARTASCVVHIGTPIDKCREINQARSREGSTAHSYDQEVFENLIYRYEEPNGMNRWDSPLFTVPFDDDSPPCDKIWDALIGPDGHTKAVRPNAATVEAPQTEVNYLQDLDKATQEIVGRISEWQKDHPGEGGDIFFDNLGLTLPQTTMPMPQLQRLRRQFTAMNRQTQISKARIQGLFVEFINDSLA